MPPALIATKIVTAVGFSVLALLDFARGSDINGVVSLLVAVLWSLSAYLNVRHNRTHRSGGTGG